MKTLEKAKDNMKKHNSSMDEWNKEHPNATVEDLMNKIKSMLVNVLSARF